MGKINYHDIDLYGAETVSGSAKTYQGESAIKNAFNNYLMSDPGDILFFPEMGGLVVRLFHKNMNGVSLANAARVMRTTINDEFGGITIANLNLVPDYEAGLLVVDIDYIINATGSLVSNAVNILTSVQNETYEYQSIIYVEENLLNFCTQQKPNMGNNTLGFDADLVKFRWGQYVFTNFDTNDAYFDEILITCNT